MSTALRTLEELNLQDRERLDGPQRPDDFDQAPALIVLGDPGAGKTHLIRQAAAGAGAHVLTAKRAIAPSTKLPAGPRVFIDALDEVSGDVEEALSEIISKLENAGAPAVMLTCRAQDWHTAAGLQALQDVYGEGNVRVCLLLPLDEAGATAVLEGRVEDPQAFLAEAAQRGLSGFLKNPNDLLLLTDAVKLGWPATRKDLFEKAIAAVLNEQNPNHLKRHNFQHEELIEAAGWISASVLVAGSEDLAVDGSELVAASTPSLDRAHVEAALKSRAFATTGVSRVAPAHRTVAEFLAGRWLARAMDTAIHESRVRALLVARDGAPPPSLRGVFAWTVNFLAAQKARDWLAADPVSLVLHGDVSILQTGQQVQLLEALAATAARDPDLGGWVGADRWGLLIAAETAAAVTKLLLDPSVSDLFKDRLLEGATAVSAPAALAPTFLRLAEDAAGNVEVRLRAVEAYCAARSNPEPLLRLLDRLNQSSTEDPELHIRGALLRAVPTPTAAMILATARAMLRQRNTVGLGRISTSVRKLPVAEVEILLDGLLPFARRKGAAPRSERPSESEAQQILVQAVARLLDEAPAALTDVRLIGLHKAEILPLASSRKGLQARLVALGRRSSSAAALLFRTDVLPGDPKKLYARYVHAFEINSFLSQPEALVGEVVQLAEAATDPGQALELCHCAAAMMMNQPMPDAVFATLYDLVTTRPELAAAKDAVTLREPRPATAWAARQRSEQANRDATLAALRQAVLQQHNALSVGRAPRLAQVLGNLYGGFDGDGVGSLAEDARFKNLVAGLGEDVALIAANALSAALPTMTFPTPPQAAASILAGQNGARDFAMLAAMDIRHSHDPEAITKPEVLPDPLAGALLLGHLENGFDARDPFSGADLGAESWPAKLVAKRPQAARQALMGYVQPLLAGGADHVAGLYQLCHAAEFEPVRQSWATEILIACPDAGATNSPELFGAALFGSENPRLLAAAPGILVRPDLSDDARIRWTTACWLLDPATYDQALRAALASSSVDTAWAAVATIKGAPRTAASRRLTEQQIVLLLEALAPVFPYAGPPSSGWSGDQNPWDGAEFINGLLISLGSVATYSAAATLQAMSQQPALSSYLQAVLRAGVTAMEGAREKDFKERELKPVSAALIGGPPADIVDAVATLAAELRDLGRYYRSGADTNWRKFWNLSLDRKATPTRLKSENECRNYLLPDLQSRLRGYAMRAEELTTNNDRIDLVAEWRGAKIPIEAKIDDNVELWDAASGQLSERYVADYQSGGYGVYLAFWSGEGRGRSMPAPPNGHARPTSPLGLESLLTALLTERDRARVTVVVMDLHAPVTSSDAGAQRRKTAPKPANQKVAKAPGKMAKSRSKTP